MSVTQVSSADKQMVRLIITGHMRSGTTFLSNFLNSQEGFYIYSDFNKSIMYNAQLYNLKSLNQKLSDVQKNVFLAELVAEWSSLGFKKPPFKREDFDSTIDLLRLSIDYIPRLEEALDDNVQMVGIKTTNEDVFIKDFISNEFKVIIMVRDPRDILISSKNRFAWYNIHHTIYKIKVLLDLYVKYSSHKNVMIVKYEDLMIQPKQTLDAVLGFLDIKYEINYNIEFLKSRNFFVYKENSSFGDIDRLFDNKGIGRWKNLLDSKEVRAANIILKDELNHFNYESGQTRTSDLLLLMRYKFYSMFRDFKSFIRSIVK